MRHKSQSVLRRPRWWVVGLVALMWMGAAVAQGIYKWVDSKGVTQYSATPPPPGVSATFIPSVPGPSAEAASQAKADAKRQIDDANRRAAERAREQSQRPPRDAAGQRDEAVRVRACATAREQLSVVERGGPVFRYNERRERIYLADSARDAEIARLRGEVATSCRGDAAAQDAATRQRVAEAARFARCDHARDGLRDLEALGSRVVAADIELARQSVSRFCSIGQPDSDEAQRTAWQRWPP